MRIFFRTLIAALWIGIFFAFLSTTHIFRPIKDDKQVLNIFSWPEILNPEIIKKFERETGITVVRHYYTSNEELLVKLKASQGKGYDLIIPSDYAVKKLIEENLLKPIDHSQLDFVATLNPKLMCQDFDPQNTYSLPFIWEVLGFGIDRDAYQDLPFDPSWQEIFCPTH
ncbi:MAG: extracellular solute-binding protein, partial [Chlamydiia bacterium]|nr:extracellular solute-binding protein [Chlamydiia bacterium]